jgi:hypothetical protein
MAMIESESLNNDAKKLEYMKMSILQGDLNKMLLENEKTSAQVIELLKQMSDLRKSKINIDEIKGAAEEFKKAQHEKMIHDHAAMHGTFVLAKHHSFTDYFRDTDDYYNRRKITEVHILTGSINNHHNTVKLTIKTMPSGWGKQEEKDAVISVEEKKYVKGEKLLEIINKGGWEPIEGTPSM